MQETIGQRIKAIRESRGLDQIDLAHNADMNQGYLSQIESGKRQPSYPTLKALARALGVPLTALDPDLTEADLPNGPRAASNGLTSAGVAALEVGAA